MTALNPYFRKTIINIVNLRNFGTLNYCGCLIDNYSLQKKHWRPQRRTVATTPKLITDSVDNIQIDSLGIVRTLSESAPVQFVQSTLVDIHTYTGLPWWATIICSTVILRSTTTLPLAVYQQYILAKLELLKYEMNDLIVEIKKETSMAMKAYHLNETTTKHIFNSTVKSHWNRLIVRENCHPFKATLLLWVQIPLWISLSMSFRNLIYMKPVHDNAAETIFSQLCTEGIGWISNLTVIDGNFVLPVLLGIVNLSLIEIMSMSKVRVPTRFQRICTNVFRGFTIILIPICATLPSGLVLYWTTSSVFGLVQNIVLLSPKVKRIFRIPPTPSELEQPYKQIAAGMKNRFSFKFKNIEKS